jgi:hypothetical protein
MTVAAVTAPISQIEQVAEKAAIESAVVVAVLVTVVRLCLVSVRFVISLVVSVRLVVSVSIVLLAIVVPVAVASEHGVPFSADLPILGWSLSNRLWRPETVGSDR